MYECPGCGGNLKFDIATQQMKCPYCDSQYDPYAVKDKTDDGKDEYYEVNVFLCPQCGGEMLSGDTDVTAFCSFCGTANILSGRLVREKKPERIIPFRLTKEECKKAYLNRVKKAWFVPKEYKDTKFVDGFRGIYMPYWQYEFSHNDKLTMEGTYTYTKGNYEYTEHHELSGMVDAECDGISFDASSSFSDNISEKLAPFDISKEKPFTSAYLSGFYADTADLDENVYNNGAREIAGEGIYAKIKKEPAFKKYTMEDKKNREKISEALKTDATHRMMYPVWFMSYRNGNRVAYATINGQNGRVAADLPKDPKKYVIASLLLAVPLFFLLNLLPAFLPKTLLAIVTVCTMLSVWLYNSELHSIQIHDGKLDDLGAITKMKERRRAELAAGWEELTDQNPELLAEKKDAGQEQNDNNQKKDEIKLEKESVGGMCIGMAVVLLFGCIFGKGFPFAVSLVATIAAFFINMGIKSRRAQLKYTGFNPAGMILIVDVISAVLILMNLINDIIYYGAAAVCLVLVVMLLLEVVRRYNDMITRPLPQFEKKGGDDNA